MGGSGQGDQDNMIPINQKRRGSRVRLSLAGLQMTASASPKPSSQHCIVSVQDGLLRDTLQVVKVKGGERYTVKPVEEKLSFDKGFYVFIRAVQLLVSRNSGPVLVSPPQYQDALELQELSLNVHASIELKSIQKLASARVLSAQGSVAL